MRKSRTFSNYTYVTYVVQEFCIKKIRIENGYLHRMFTYAGRNLNQSLIKHFECFITISQSLYTEKLLSPAWKNHLVTKFQDLKNIHNEILSEFQAGNQCTL